MPLWARRGRGIGFVSLLVGVAACSTARIEGRTAAPPRLPPPAVQGETDFHCARAAMDRDSPYRMPLAGPELDPVLSAHLAAIPPEARRAALAAGLEPLLSRLLHERAIVGDEGPTPRFVLLRQELTLRLVAFHAQVAAAAFEAGCTADMIQKLLAERTRHEQSRQVSIAVTSLVAGAVAGVAAGVWGLANQESRGPPILAIAGGAASTVLGAEALTHEDPATTFQHARNRLAPVWRGADPEHLYPSFVFRMLTLPPAIAGARTPRDQLVETWQQQLEAALPASSLAAAQRLLMSEGGTYNGELLTLRAEMFESLESAVQGTARDLELLNRSLVRALTSGTLDTAR